MTQASFDAAEREFGLAERSVDERAVAECQLRMGDALMTLGRVDEGERLIRSALAALRRCDAPKMRTSMLLVLGMAKFESGDHAGATSLCTEALAIAREHAFDRIQRVALSNLAELEFYAGDTQAALELVEEALGLAQVEEGHGWRKALTNTAAYLLALGRYAEARLRAREALELCRSAGAESTLAYRSSTLRQSLLSTGRKEAIAAEVRARGARLLGYVDARLAALGAPRERTENKGYAALVATLTEAFGAESIEKYMEDGQALREEQSFAETLLV